MQDLELSPVDSVWNHDERVIKFMDSDGFKASKTPVDTAQCNQIMGYCNFAREVLGIGRNVCKNHVLAAAR